MCTEKMSGEMPKEFYLKATDISGKVLIDFKGAWISSCQSLFSNQSQLKGTVYCKGNKMATENWDHCDVFIAGSCTQQRI